MSVMTFCSNLPAAGKTTYLDFGQRNVIHAFFSHLFFFPFRLFFFSRYCNNVNKVEDADNFSTHHMYKSCSVRWAETPFAKPAALRVSHKQSLFLPSSNL